MRSPNRIVRLFAMCGVVAAINATSASGATDQIIAVANQDHLWFVIESKPATRGYSLCHHALDMGGPFFLPQGMLGQSPVAMASWGDRVWVVMERRHD